MTLRHLINAILISLALNACVSAPAVKMGEYYPRKIDNLDQLVSEIQERNNTLEKHPAWISLAEQDFMLKKLDDLPESGYSAYKKYLDDGTLYIIVHPAYSVFFSGAESPLTSQLPIDAFLNETSFTERHRFVQEQERSMRDFLEITSTRKRLIILVIPADYRDFIGYVYKDSADEYARYINSVTNNSESVIYLYSKKPNNGHLSEDTKKRLLKFIEAVNPSSIVIGGGYLGRCVADFYSDLAPLVGREKLSVAAEITAISSEDLRNFSVSDFLKDGKLNITALREVINSKDMKGSSLKDFMRSYNNFRTQQRR